MIQSSVVDIASRFGYVYVEQCARYGVKADELWQAVASVGFAGVNIPAQYGEDGGSIIELALVIEELATAG